MTSVPCNTERLLLDLTKLPRARRLRSVRFRRTTPGKASRLITPFIASKNDRILDPKHPAAKVPLSQFVHKQVPSFRDHSASSLLGIRAFPKALLEKNEFAWLQEDWPYKARGKSNYFVMDGGKSKDGNKAGGADVSKGNGQVRVLGGAKRVNMSVLFVISKKLVHKDACVRTRIKNRIKSALSLLITRDVEVALSAPNIGSGQDSSKQKTALVSAGTDDGEKWIMQDWVYIFYPKLDVYRAPFNEIVSSLRLGLGYVNKRCRELETFWSSGRSTSRSILYSGSRIIKGRVVKFKR